MVQWKNRVNPKKTHFHFKSRLHGNHFGYEAKFSVLFSGATKPREAPSDAARDHSWETQIKEIIQGGVVGSDSTIARSILPLFTEETIPGLNCSSTFTASSFPVQQAICNGLRP